MSIELPEWIEPEQRLADRVRVVSTTRLGGVSKPPYDSLNLGLHVGDDEVSVRENRRRVGEVLALPAEPAWLHQCHGTDICCVGKQPAVDTITADQAGRQPFDGALTREPGVVLAIMTADCLPVVLADRDGEAVAALHAGWRGLADGILDRAIGALALPEERLSAWLGPAIGPAHFEVGEEVRQRFLQWQCGDAVHQAFQATGQNGKWLADLYLLARLTLNRHGITEIQGGDHCTWQQARLFHSYRRDGSASGRMATLAWID